MKRVLSLTLSVLLAVTLFSCANPVSDDLYYVAPTTENTPSQDETPNTEGEDTTTSEPSNPTTPIKETPEVPTVEDEPETPSQDETTNDNSTEETPEVSNEETPQPEIEDTTSEDSPIIEEPTDTEDTIPGVETSTEIPSNEVFTGYSNGSCSFKLSEEHLVLISDCNAVYNILDYQLQIYPHGANYDYYYYYLLERNGDMYGMTITVILDPDGNYVRNWDFYFVVNNPYGLVQNWVENKNIRKALMSGTKMTNFVRTYPYEN